MYNFLLNAGVNYHTKRLDILRQKSINIFSLAFIFVMLISIVFRLLGGEYYVALSTVLAISIIMLSFYFSYKNKFAYSIFISWFSPILLFLLVAINNKLSGVNLVGPLIVLIIVFLIIIRKERNRWLFLTMNIFILIWVTLRYDNSLLHTGSLAIQMFGICTGFIYFVRYLEDQDTELEKALQKEMVLNKKLSDRNDDLQTFSHIMTHDLKAPIRHINSFTKLIRLKAKDLDENLTEYFSYIEKSSSHMETLITDLLNVQKINQESIQLKTVNLNSVLRKIQETHYSSIVDRKNEMVYSNLPLIKGDESLMKTLFTNLISNGFKYQPLNNPDHIPTVKVFAKTTNDNIRIIIKDNGIGINQKNAKSIFEPFKRLHSARDYSGTGLGLSICKKVMEKHRGNIEILNGDCSGTKIQLTFPLS